MKCYHKFESVRTAISLGIGKAKITPPLFKETSVSKSFIHMDQTLSKVNLMIVFSTDVLPDTWNDCSSNI